jgi:hypothetical protein
MSVTTDCVFLYNIVVTKYDYFNRYNCVTSKEKYRDILNAGLA